MQTDRKRSIKLKSWGPYSAHQSCFILDVMQWIACPVVAGVHSMGSQVTSSSLILSQRGSLHVVQDCCEMWAKVQQGGMSRRCVSNAHSWSKPRHLYQPSQVFPHYLYFSGKWLTNFITLFVSNLGLGEVKDS